MAENLGDGGTAMPFMPPANPSSPCGISPGTPIA